VLGPERQADPAQPAAGSANVEPDAVAGDAPTSARDKGVEPGLSTAHAAAGPLFTVVPAGPELVEADDDDHAPASDAAPCADLATQLAERKAAARSPEDASGEHSERAKACAAHRAELIGRFYAGGSLEKGASKGRAKRGTRTTKAQRGSSATRKRKARAKPEKLEPQLEPAPPKTRQLTLFDAIEGGAGHGAKEPKLTPVAPGTQARPTDDAPGLTLVSGPAKASHSDGSDDSHNRSDSSDDSHKE
jgi:hypothetical protein